MRVLLVAKERRHVGGADQHSVCCHRQYLIDILPLTVTVTVTANITVNVTVIITVNVTVKITVNVTVTLILLL